MNILAKLFNQTLAPTEREELVGQSAKFKQSADKWFQCYLDTRADLKRTEAECRRLQVHVDNQRALFDFIAAQETAGANATVKRMAKAARAGQAK